MDYYRQLYYLRLLSVQLERFKESQDGVWNCRCPVCGDSKTNKFKARGYFFKHDNSIFFKCHNCSYSSSLISLLKTHFKALYNEVLIDRYKDKENEKEALKTQIRGVLSDYREDYTKSLKAIQLVQDNIYLKGLLTFDKVNDDIPCKQYLVNRGLTDYLNRFYYIPNVKAFVDKLEHYKTKYNGKKYNEAEALAGVGIPHFSQDKSRLEFMQIRFIDADIKKRYITYRVEALQEAVKVFGLERLDLDKHYISITEGAFDSVFADNCIATSGVSDYKRIIELLEAKGIKDKGRVRFILDSDWRYNKQVRKILNDIIFIGCSIVIFPKHIHEKDLNDMVLSGLSVEELNDMIDRNTYTGLQAKLALSKNL